MKMLMSPPEGYPLVLAKTLCMLSQRVKLPKHVGFGMSIHQVARSRTLVSLFHNAGHSINYSQVQRVDTILTKIRRIGVFLFKCSR